MQRFGWFLTLLMLLCLPTAAMAQVDASLVSTQQSLQPGQPVTVALRLQHQSGWHTFWQRAGTGLPTRIEWELPTGWQMGAIQWPVPTLVRNSLGEVSGYGYEGLTYLPVELTAPAHLAPGSTVTLRATARWLMCETLCIPGKQQVSLSLTVSAQAAQANADVVTQLATMSMPQPASGWTLAASRDSREVTLNAAASFAMNTPHFYPLDAFIDYKQPETIANSDNRAMLKMALDAEETVPEDARLRGVLAYTDAEGRYRGVQVDVPFTSAAAAAQVSAMATSADAGVPATASLSLGVLLLALLGGLILNLMPCVFPVLGIKVLGFVEQADKNRGKVAAHAWAFAGGVLLSFWTLAALLALLRSGGEQLGWGFQLQSPAFVFVLAVVMLVFALNLSGVFEMGMRATAVGSRLQTRQGVAGSFFTGVLATVVATPCSAPFLAPALGAALAMPAWQSFVLFTVIAFGLSAPYLLLAMFPSLIRFLPRPGAWMETFKQLMAFPLYATVAYLLWVLAGQASEYALLNALLALPLLAMSLWIYGRFPVPHESPVRQARVIVPALLLFVLALGWGWPRPPKPDAVQWQPWSPERVVELQQQGRGIYVDFTARWCATCQVNKKVVFGSKQVQAYFRDHDIVALKADWTNADPRITAELAKYGRSAVPFNLVYLQASPSTAPSALPEVLTPDIVLEAFENP